MHGGYEPEGPSAKKVRADIEEIWNAEQLTLDKFDKSGSISEVIDKYPEILRHRRLVAGQHR